MKPLSSLLSLGCIRLDKMKNFQPLSASFRLFQLSKIENSYSPFAIGHFYILRQPCTYEEAYFFSPFSVPIFECISIIVC